LTGLGGGHHGHVMYIRSSIINLPVSAFRMAVLLP
jgi:hypothetical protein